MTELGHTSAVSTATHTPATFAGTMTDVSKASTDADARSIKTIRRLVGINLGLVALQPLSAGLFLSGYERAVTVHAMVAVALQLGAIIQAILAGVLWRRRRIPAWVGSLSIRLLVVVLIQVGLGYSKQYWLHVPLGVGLFGALIGQKSRLDALWRTTGAQL